MLTLTLPLFASTVILADVDPGLQHGVGYSATLGLGMMISKLLGFFDKRDERRHDARMREMEAKIVACESHRDECKTLKDEHAVLKSDYAELKKTVERMRRRAEKRHPEDAENDSREHVPLDDVTSEHKPLSPG